MRFVESVVAFKRATDENERTSLGIAICKKCQDMIKDAEYLYESGDISRNYYEEIVSNANEIYTNTRKEFDKLYCEGVVAAGFALGTKELKLLLSSPMVNLIPVSEIGNKLTKPISKFIRARMMHYTKFYPDCIPFKELDKVSYGFDEFEDTSHIRFKTARKWHEQGLRVKIDAWVYHEKIACAVAFTERKNENSAMECVVVNPRMKKYQDYYIAGMCASTHLSHPAIKRILEDIKKNWKYQAEENIKGLKKAVFESVQNNSFDEKMRYIEESHDKDFMTDEEYELYKKECLKNWCLCK